MAALLEGTEPTPIPARVGATEIEQVRTAAQVFESWSFTYLFDLAVLGHNLTQATDRLTAAAAGHTASYARSRAICLTKLASLTMATGDPIQAATIGHAALDAAGTIRSRRTADDLRELARYAATHQHLDSVAHLRQRIGTLLVCTDSS